MSIFEKMNSHDCEQLVFCSDNKTGLKAIIAIHDTTLGPALGGTRMWPYNNEEEAVYDVLRLSRGMTYKSAAAGLPLGGGKAVIIGDPAVCKSEALLESYGKYLESLNGNYITAEDVGTSQQDMDIINRTTSYVTGRSPSCGGCGDPSPFTARGVFYGIKAAVKHKYGINSLQGLKIAVQGVGNVGYNLCLMLAGEGASLYVTDISEKAVQRVCSETGGEPVFPPEKIYEVDCDIFAPCALGAVINDGTIGVLKCGIVAGGANNVLAGDHHGTELQKRDILYVPDYVINAGGVINVAGEVLGYREKEVENRVAQIYHNVMEVFSIAEKQGVSTDRAADILAEKRISEAEKGTCKGVHRVV